MNSSNDSLKKPTSFIVSFDNSNAINSSITASDSTNTLISTSNPTNTNPAYSLQDAFKKYRDEKIVSSIYFTLMPSLPDSIRK
jgi:hypothetical protein